MAKIICKLFIIKDDKRVIENYVASAGCVVWVERFQNFLIKMPQFAFKFFYGSPPDKRIVRLDYVAAEINAVRCRLKNLFLGMKLEF